MDTPSAWVADAANQLCELVIDAEQLTLRQRLEAFAAATAQLYAAALQLGPAVGPTPEDPGAAPVIPGWPGFGSLDEYWPGAEPHDLSVDVLRVFEGAFRGLAHWEEGDPESAAWMWRVEFDRHWGEVAARLLIGLHRGIERFREDELPRARAGIELPEIVPVSPTGPPLPSAEAPELPQEPRAVLGLRFEPGIVGMELTAVHPDGPAGGLLVPGDILLSVADIPLDGMTIEEAGGLMQGAVGVPIHLQIYREGETWEVELAPVDASTL